MSDTGRISPAMVARVRTDWARLLGCVAVAVLVGFPGLLAALVVQEPSLQRERSWEIVVLDAIARNLRFGVDVNYTFGPFADLYLNHYHPELVTRTILGKVLVLSALAFGAWAFTQRLQIPRLAQWTVSLILVVVPATQMHNVLLPDVLFFAVLLLVQVAYLRQPSTGRALVMAVATASCVLVKFSFAPLWLCAAVLPLVVPQHARRRWLHCAAVLLALPLAWWAASQALSDLPAYLSGGTELAKGYGPAMAIQNWRARSHVVIAAGLMSLVVALGAANLRTEGRRQQLGALLVFASSAFLVFKAGFTRHDIHVWIPAAWLASIGASTFLLAACRRRVWVLGCGAIAAFYLMANGPYGAPRMPGMSDVARQVNRIVAWGLHPALAAADLEQEYQASRAQVRTDPLFELSRRFTPDDADVSNQIPVLVARGRETRFRPVFQSTAAFTPALAAANRSYLQHLSRGANVLLAAWTIDNRFPGLQQSGAWDLLLDEFSVVHDSTAAVVLQKVGPGRIRCESQTATGAPLQWQALDAGRRSRYVIAFPQLRQTALAKIQSLVLSDPQVNIETRSGREISLHRYVVPMGQSGFLLWPTIEGSRSLAQLWAPTAVESERIDAVRIVPVSRLSVYQPELTWRFDYCDVRE